MLHAKYIIYLTRTLSSLNKKTLFAFCVPPPSQKESMQCGSNFFCWLTLVESGNLLLFLHRRILTDINCTLTSEGSVGAVLLSLISLLTNMLSCFVNYRIILMAGFVAFFPQLDQVFDPQKKIRIYFLP